VKKLKKYYGALSDKKNYAAYYELALKLLRPGGIVAIDNTLLHGMLQFSHSSMIEVVTNENRQGCQC